MATIKRAFLLLFHFFDNGELAFMCCKQAHRGTYRLVSKYRFYVHGINLVCWEEKRQLTVLLRNGRIHINAAGIFQQLESIGWRPAEQGRNPLSGKGRSSRLRYLSITQGASDIGLVQLLCVLTGEGLQVIPHCEEH